MFMRYMLRWWETLGRPERIVAMSLAVGGAVAVTNSTVWAIAVSYMTHQKTKVALAAAQSGATGAIRVGVAATRASGGAANTMTENVPPEHGIVFAGS